MVVLLVVLSAGFFLLLGVVIFQNIRIAEILRSTREQSQARDLKVAEDEGSRRAALEGAIRSLEDKLKMYDALLREWEKDRALKFGQLERELTMSSQATLRLQDTTSKLTNILGNVKLRGQWGERMAEDIIRYAGLLEGVNYRQQKTQGPSGSRPDFVFLLPDDRVLNMDVKFPLDNYLRMVNAASDLERDSFEKEFFKNVRARMKEIHGREYINTTENTLDFVLLFIPNEQVFGFIQEKAPGIMEEAFKEKVVLCSPFTLYATLSVIRQAHENFRFEKDVKKILGHIDLFVKHFETMKGRFLEFGVLIQKLDQKYAELAETSFKNLDTKLRHIEDYKKGQGLTASLPSDGD